MRVLFVPSEAAATVLQTVTKPGIEVCYPDQEIDSVGITEVIIIASTQGFSSAWFNHMSKRIAERASPQGCSLTIILT